MTATSQTKGAADFDPAAPFLQLEDAVVRRGGREILRVDRFEMQQGEVIALLGPNGSGKSTFIKLITREIMPLYRERPPVRFRGNPRAALADVRKALGVVSASMQDEITVHLPVVDIVAGGFTGTLGLPFHVSDELSALARRQAALACDRVGIADLLDRDVMTLSTGQSRRALVARALVADPETLVFDEPSTGLDPQGMHYVRKSIRSLVQLGKGVVLVTHYPEDVIPEVTRLVLIKEGRVIEDGPKEELLTSEVMSELFDIPVKISCTEGYYALATSY